MSAAQTLERIAMEAEKEASSLRQIAAQLRRLGAQVTAAVGGTATGEDRTMLGYVRAIERDMERAANEFANGARHARTAAAEERRREQDQQQQQQRKRAR